MTPNEGRIRNAPTFHVHPSSLDSASTPEAFLEKELELGSGGLTVTDHGSLNACRKIYDLAKANGLNPHLGLEGYLKDENCGILTKNGYNPKEYCKYFHVTSLFLDQEAFETASKIISKAKYERHGEEAKPLFTWDDYAELGSKNTVLGSSCLIGAVSRHLLDHGSPENAEAYYVKLRSLAKPGNFFVEIFPHVCDKNWDSGIYLDVNDGTSITTLKFKPKKKLKTNAGEVYAEDLVREFNRKDTKHEVFMGQKDYRQWNLRPDARILKVERREGYIQNECNTMFPNGDVQRTCNEFILKMAAKYGDPVTISEDAHYASPELKIAQDVRLMASGGTWRMSNVYARRSGLENWEYFDKIMGIPFKQFEEWTQNAFDLSSRFKDFKFNYKPELATRFYPANTLVHLKALIQKHGRMRWNDQAYVDRLKREIELFHDNSIVDLLPYFFVYEEIAELYQKKNKLCGPGRGSAAGVMISYLLGITHLDPIQHNLSLERFITLDRIKSGSFPDIDFDLSDRTDLLGGEKEVIECETDSGLIVTFEKGQIVKTTHGLLKIEDALMNGVEIL